MWLERKTVITNTNHSRVVGTEKELTDRNYVCERSQNHRPTRLNLEKIGWNVKLRTVDDEQTRRNGVSNKEVSDEGCNVRVKLFHQRERKENFRDRTN